MPKEFYKVSYKTYFNERVKPVQFRRRDTYPLYVQITYDRKSTSLKSYYFDVFSQPKYDYIGMTIDQMDALESRVIDFVTAKYSDRFTLADFPAWYKVFNKCVLDSLETPFKEWLIGYFEAEKVAGYAALLRQGMQEVSALELLDEFKTALAPDLYERLITKAAAEGPPYIPLAAYVRDRQPKGPFCLPLHDWIQHERQVDAEDFIYHQYRDYQMAKILKTIRLLLHPHGYPT
jgi:hypothetical protein